MEQKIIFSNFVSLGNACHVAASMGKYGLRSESGLFDWLVTIKLQWVLHYMENDFGDFLKKENLEKEPTNKNSFIEKTSDFAFLHEKNLYSKEYDLVKLKYEKLKRRFLDTTAKPTCFLRSVYDYDELTYIKENSDYIRSVIQENNKDNEIVHTG